MTEYRLYLESGPKRRKTMIHVLDLLGCIANGPTTEEALEATPETIEAYLGFLKRQGEDVDPQAKFSTAIGEHITEGIWLGNGSPYVTYGPDLEPLSEADIEVFLNRFHGLTEELAIWATGQTAAKLDTAPAAGGRTARAILLHALSATGPYLSAGLQGVTGFSRLTTRAERGEISLPAALRQVEAMANARLRAATAEERSAVIQRPKEIRTLRKIMRRMLEHHWEHLAELSRRPGGPPL
jgi:predicted RNase H-like HicB family nuclease